MKQADLRYSVQKGHQDFLYINRCGASWSVVSYSNLFSFEDSLNHKRGWLWPLTSRWRRYPNGILPWIVVQSK